jgi:hypothetical protein
MGECVSRIKEKSREQRAERGKRREKRDGEERRPPTATLPFGMNVGALLRSSPRDEDRH